MCKWQVTGGFQVMTCGTECQRRTFPFALVSELSTWNSPLYEAILTKLVSNWDDYRASKIVIHISDAGIKTYNALSGLYRFRVEIEYPSQEPYAASEMKAYRAIYAYLKANYTEEKLWAIGSSFFVNSTQKAIANYALNYSETEFTKLLTQQSLRDAGF